jgi:hypothetical protein
MARSVFFSFHYKRDVWRAYEIRHTWVTKDDIEDAGYIDAAEFEKVEKEGKEAVKKWIDSQLNGTSVTVVLVGAETSDREYVDYEIEQSSKRGNGLLAIYINKLKDQDKKTDIKGKNPFDLWYKTVDGEKKYFSSIYSTYDWVDDNGYENLGQWIEEAAERAGK